MTGLDILVALAVVVGLVGVIVPVLPGTLMVGGLIALWAWLEPAWWLLVTAVAITAATMVLKFALPARTASKAASTAALVVGALAALVGFFVIPVVGMIIGFLAGVLGSEWYRRRELRQAWDATWVTTKSIGVTMAIEIAAIIVMAGLWAVALLAR